MNLADQWRVLGCELIQRDNRARLIVREVGGGECLVVDTQIARRMGLDLAYCAGWLEGVVSVLSGEVDARNIFESFAICANNECEAKEEG